MGSKSTTTRTVYGNTTTSNPYAYSKTNNQGTLSGFNDGTAFKSVYDVVNNSIDSLLSEYLNPNPESQINNSRIKQFSNTLAQQTRNNFEKDIINPLSKRNMLRSSQATDLYRNLINQNILSTADYVNNLYTQSSDDAGKKLSNLLSLYMLGANYLSDMQNQSLATSSGNATKYSSSGSDLVNTLIPIVVRSIMQ